MAFFNEEEINKIVKIAIEAGEIAKKFHQLANLKVAKKPDNSSVSEADTFVSQFIGENLYKEFPKIPVICEEGSLRQALDIFWLIDPIDGTSSFIEGSVEFAINIALIKDGKAVFGLIYAPLFEGGKLAFSDHEDRVALLFLKQKYFLTAKKFDQNKLRIITSKRTSDAVLKNYIAQFYQDFSGQIVVEKLSSAIKFLRILEDDADLYLHFRQSMEWDTAAGQAMIELMGGKVQNLFFDEDKYSLGEVLSYRKSDFTNDPFILSVKKI